MASSLAPEIQGLIRSTDFVRLRERLVGFTPVEIAETMLDLERDEQVLAFRALPRALAADVFEYLRPADQQARVKTMGQEDVAALLNNMAPDDRTVLFEELPANATRHRLR